MLEVPGLQLPNYTKTLKWKEGLAWGNNAKVAKSLAPKQTQKVAESLAPPTFNKTIDEELMKKEDAE